MSLTHVATELLQLRERLVADLAVERLPLEETGGAAAPRQDPQRATLH